MTNPKLSWAKIALIRISYFFYSFFSQMKNGCKPNSSRKKMYINIWVYTRLYKIKYLYYDLFHFQTYVKISNNLNSIIMLMALGYFYVFCLVFLKEKKRIKIVGIDIIKFSEDFLFHKHSFGIYHLYFSCFIIIIYRFMTSSCWISI